MLDIVLACECKEHYSFISILNQAIDLWLFLLRSLHVAISCTTCWNNGWSFYLRVSIFNYKLLLKQKLLFLRSWELYRDHLLFVHSHTCLSLFPSCLLLLVYLDHVRCICVVYIVYTLSIVVFAVVAFSLSISFILMVFVFATFTNCFHMEWYYNTYVIKIVKRAKTKHTCCHQASLR